tara:strand:+ start:1093 stop:1488 length:396 start_codon:yes stop_codon:yes gene_type:complete
MQETCNEYIEISKKNFKIGNYELAYRQALRCQLEIENLFNVSSSEVQIRLLSLLYQSSKIISDSSNLFRCKECAIREVRHKVLEYQTISEQSEYEQKTRQAASFYLQKLEIDLKKMTKKSSNDDCQCIAIC